MRERILIVEDEPKLAAVLRDYLQAEGYEALIEHHGSAVLRRVREETPDALLLDVMLPGEDGLTLLRKLRESSSVPVLMATARIEEIDRLLGFDFGADDYICKPYSLREVGARLRAVLRRARGAQEPAAESSLLLDEERMQLRCAGQTVALTPVEFRIMERLLRRRGRICTREQLLAAAYDDHRIVAERTLSSHVRNLRRKLDEIGLDAIHSVYGSGFRFELDEG
ncbi:MAG: response regulator [Rhodanobacteraceae bacterium]|nr:response regulator [Rhodanobacteraceae bacterium]